MQGLRFLATFTGLLVCFQASYSIQDNAPSRRHNRRMLFPNAVGAKNGDGGTGGCKDYVIVCARGTGEPQTGSFAYAGLISEVLSAVPNGIKRETIYPASMDYFSGPSQGALEAMKYIGSQLSSCPKQKYVFVGYSEGAMVVTQILNNPKLPADKFLAAVLLGNPHHEPNAAQNQCTAKTGRGVSAMMPVKVPQAYTTKVFDCCLVGDSVCAPGGGTGMAHLGYATSPFMKTAAQFIIARLKGNSLAGGSQAPAETPSKNQGQKSLVKGNLPGSTPSGPVGDPQQGFPGLSGVSGGLPGFSGGSTGFPGSSGFGLPSRGPSGQTT